MNNNEKKQLWVETLRSYRLGRVRASNALLPQWTLEAPGESEVAGVTLGARSQAWGVEVC